MNTYAKLIELEQRVNELEARLAVLDAPKPKKEK